MTTQLPKALLRRAIFNVYNGQFHFCRRPFGHPKDMQLDHIISKDKIKKAESISKIIDLYNLDNDFEMNSIENLGPICSTCNIRKSNNEFNPIFIEQIIRESKANVGKVLREAGRLADKEKYYDSLTIVKQVVELDDCLMNEALEMLLDEESEYEERREVKKYEDIGNSYSRSCLSAEIDAHLPMERLLIINCLLGFKSLKIRDAIITLNNDSILKHLFK